MLFYILHKELLQDSKKFFHPTYLEKLKVDFMSLSGHKISGPKGIGCLYVRNLDKINSMMTGGHQEKNKRAGTSNTPGIVGFGQAISLLKENFDNNLVKTKELNNYFKKLIFQNYPNIRINGSELKSSKIINIYIKDFPAQEALFKLDQSGFAVSAGSACNSGSVKQSYVLKAMKMRDGDIKCCIRISFGKITTKKQIKKILDQISRITK